MSQYGNLILAAAFLLTTWSVLSGFYAASVGKVSLSLSAERALKSAAALVVVSLLILAYLFLTHDYSVAYVWRTSNNSMPAVYLVSAIWGGMDGSLLLWTAIIAAFAWVACSRKKTIRREIYLYLVPCLAVSVWFFLGVTLFLTNPFRPSPVNILPPDGNGLNPLLQNPSMLIHPPLLYLGFTGFMVPAAFCFAALLSGRLDGSWATYTRFWTLVAWCFLTAGIVLGGNWAYIELGWGGYWAWDPVENASFMPWLTGTAFLHSIMVERYRSMLRIWNISLAIGTYLLAIFGTFLTRSGVVQSVHAFAETDVGWVFLAYIGVLSIIALFLIFYRKSSLESDKQIESYISREAVFLLNNMLLLCICASTLWGVLFPLITEAVSGDKQVLGPPYFNAVNNPLFVSLLLFMGIGPMISWKKSSVAALKRSFTKPALIGAVSGVIYLLFTFVSLDFVLMELLAFVVITFSASCIIFEFARASRLQGGSFLEVVKRRPGRVGGLVVHLGVLVMALGIVFSSAYKTEKDLTLKIGQSQELGTYRLELVSVQPLDKANYSARRALVKVYSATSGNFIREMYPESRFYPQSGETTSEVALRTAWKEDLYLAFAGWDGELLALKVFINPLQLLVWIGAMMMLFGTSFVFAPRLFVPSGAEASSALAKGAA